MTDEQPKPCCARFEHEGRATWCQLADGHEGAHEGSKPREMPQPTFMPTRKR